LPNCYFFLLFIFFGNCGVTSFTESSLSSYISI
jgi:hypothetical protein